MYSVRISPGVNRKKAYYIKQLFKWFGRHIPCDELIRVYVMNCEKFRSKKGRDAAGMFVYRENPCYKYSKNFCSPYEKNPRIYIAGDRSIEEILTIALHEFVHYEQYVGRRNITERGVSVRMRTLEKLIIESEK
jgi:hypothetical protein